MQAVLLAGAPLQAQLAWDEAYTQQRGCPERPGGFFAAASRGVCAYFFANLHRHTFTPEVGDMVPAAGVCQCGRSSLPGEAGHAGCAID